MRCRIQPVCVNLRSNGFLVKDDLKQLIHVYSDDHKRGHRFETYFNYILVGMTGLILSGIDQFVDIILLWSA